MADSITREQLLADADVLARIAPSFASVGNRISCDAILHAVSVLRALANAEAWLATRGPKGSPRFVQYGDLHHQFYASAPENASADASAPTVADLLLALPKTELPNASPHPFPRLIHDHVAR